MLKAFLAYRKQNAGLVRRLIAALEHYNGGVARHEPPNREGYVKIFCDFHVRGGEEWDQYIQQELASSDLMFVVVTSALLNDDSSYLKTVELPLAKALGIPIIPIIYEAVLTHLDLDEVTSRHAIPEGGLAPSLIGGEAIWIERLLVAVNKRCHQLLTQQSFDASDALLGGLKGAQGAILSARRSLSVCGALLNKDYVREVTKTLDLANRVTSSTSHILIDNLRAAGDQIALRRTDPRSAAELAPELERVELSLNEARMAAMRANYPISPPISSSGQDPVVPAEEIAAESKSLSRQLDRVGSAADGVSAAARTVIQNEVSAISDHAAQQVRLQADVAKAILELPRVDTGLIARTSDAGKRKAEALSNSVSRVTRPTAEPALQSAAAKMLVETTSAADESRRLVMAARMEFGDLIEENAEAAISDLFNPFLRENAGVAPFVILLGGPGAGKGTLAKAMCRKYHFGHYMVGDVLRHEAGSGSRLGRKIKNILTKGDIIPDDLVTEAFLKQFGASDPSRRGVVFDAYPHNLQQADLLDRTMGEGGPNAVIQLTMDDSALISRVLGRYSCAKCGEIYHDRFRRPRNLSVCDVCGSVEFARRPDDTADTVTKRLMAWYRETSPVIGYYAAKEILISLDANCDIGELVRRVDRALIKFYSRR